MRLVALGTDTIIDMHNQDERKSALITTSVFASALARVACIGDPKYKRLKYRMFLARNYLRGQNIPTHQQREAVHHILEHGGSSAEIKSIPVTPHPRIFSAAIDSVKSFASTVRSGSLVQGGSSSLGPVPVAKSQAETMSDIDFIANLRQLVEELPVFERAAMYARQFALDYIKGNVRDDARKIGKAIHKLCLEQARLDHDRRIKSVHQAQDRQRWDIYKESIRTELTQTPPYVACCSFTVATQADEEADPSPQPRLHLSTSR